VLPGAKKVLPRFFQLDKREINLCIPEMEFTVVFLLPAFTSASFASLRWNSQLFILLPAFTLGSFSSLRWNSQLLFFATLRSELFPFDDQVKE
jgi:hypothetical protein